MSVYDTVDVKLTPRQIALVVMALEREDVFYEKQGNYTRANNCWTLALDLQRALLDAGHPNMLDYLR
jgi:hypothetical protein